MAAAGLAPCLGDVALVRVVTRECGDRAATVLEKHLREQSVASWVADGVEGWGVAGAAGGGGAAGGTEGGGGGGGGSAAAAAAAEVLGKADALLEELAVLTQHTESYDRFVKFLVMEVCCGVTLYVPWHGGTTICVRWFRQGFRMLDENTGGRGYKHGRALLVLVMVVECARDAENRRPTVSLAEPYPVPWLVRSRPPDNTYRRTNPPTCPTDNCVFLTRLLLVLPTSKRWKAPTLRKKKSMPPARLPMGKMARARQLAAAGRRRNDHRSCRPPSWSPSCRRGRGSRRRGRRWRCTTRRSRGR